jgi:hypothetical protein
MYSYTAALLVLSCGSARLSAFSNRRQSADYNLMNVYIFTHLERKRKEHRKQKTKGESRKSAKKKK